MTQYFFLSTLLPPLQIGTSPEIPFPEFVRLLQDNLLPEDYRQTEILRRYYDILNIRNLWRGEEFEPYGNLDRNDLEEAIINREGLPQYILNYLENYPKDEDRLKNFGFLLASFFREEVKNADPFLKEYLDFERQLRLVLVGFRSKKLGRNLAKELQYENPDEDLIAQILAQKDAPQFEPPENFEHLRTLFEEHYDNPSLLYQSLCQYRFDKIEELVGITPFDFRKILGYMAQLIIVEKWLELDRKKGLQIVDYILEQSAGTKNLNESRETT